MSSAADAPRFQVGPGMLVRLVYSVFDAEGEPVEAPDQEAEILFGFGQLLPELERGIEGLASGESRSLRLAPERAYGRRRKEGILEVDRSEFPEDVAPGDRFEVENEQGAVLVLKVLEVLSDAVVVDTNHPLADQEVRFEVRVEAVRPATEAEIEARVRAMEEPSNEPAPSNLISPDRLLRRTRQDYEEPTGRPMGLPADGGEPKPAAQPDHAETKKISTQAQTGAKTR